MLLALGYAGAQDAESAPAALSVTLGGDHQAEYRMPLYGDSWNYDGAMKTPGIDNRLGVEVDDGQVRAVSKWRVVTSPDADGNGTASTKVAPLENYVSWSPSPLKMSMGYQIFAWGSADGRNPTDNLNPRDYTDIDNGAEKIPVLSTSLNWYPSENLSLETVFLPVPGQSVFPIDYQKALLAYGFGSVRYQPVSFSPESYVAGAKINYRSQAIDLSLDYLYDYDQLYTPLVSIAGLPLPSNTSIALERKRIHRFGADAKTTVGPVGIWAEACYSLTGNTDASDYSERLSKLDYTLGMDLSYGPQDAYYLNLQYVGTVIPGYDSSANIPDPSNMTSYFQRNLVGFVGGEREGVAQGLALNARWDLADARIVPSITGSYTFPFDYDTNTYDQTGLPSGTLARYGSLFIKPQVDLVPVDSFHITIGCVLSYAWDESGNAVSANTTTDTVGIYTPSNHAFVALSYKWNYETGK
jgi:hypothetical protein